jgi:hypothetical protein
MERRKLPIGIQSFQKLRTDGFVYVDKTSYVYELAQEGHPYFLGRPRRFGKNLFLSTLKAYFEGKQNLFEEIAGHPRHGPVDHRGSYPFHQYNRRLIERTPHG